MLESLIAQYNQETRTTRRLLERIPADRFEWRPHPKSFTAGGLASHIVDCMNWVDAIFTLDELDVDPLHVSRVSGRVARGAADDVR